MWSLYLYGLLPEGVRQFIGDNAFLGIFGGTALVFYTLVSLFATLQGFNMLWQHNTHVLAIEKQRFIPIPKYLSPFLFTFLFPDQDKYHAWKRYHFGVLAALSVMLTTGLHDAAVHFLKNSNLNSEKLLFFMAVFISLGILNVLFMILSARLIIDPYD